MIRNSDVATRRRLWAPLLALLLIAACSDDDPTGVDTGIEGTWQLDSTELVFLHIAGDQIVVYDDNPTLDCFDRTVIEILDRDGDVYLLRVAGSSLEAEAEITRSGNTLRFETEGDVALYGRSGINVGVLSLCD